jgi:hypothetical protein
MKTTREQVQEWLNGEIHHSEIDTTAMSAEAREIMAQVIRNDNRERRNGYGTTSAASLALQAKLMEVC